MLSQLLRLKSHLLIPPILLWRSSSHPNIVICFIVISTYHILYSSVLQRKTFEQHLRHEYFFAFSQAFVQHSISLIFNALCLINLYAKYYYFTTKIRLRSFLSWEQTFFLVRWNLCAHDKKYFRSWAHTPAAKLSADNVRSCRLQYKILLVCFQSIFGEVADGWLCSVKDKQPPQPGEAPIRSFA